MKFHFYKVFIATAFILFQVSIATAEFKLYLDDSRTEFIMVEEQDCSVYKSENGKFASVSRQVDYFSESGLRLLLEKIQESTGTTSPRDWLPGI